MSKPTTNDRFEHITVICNEDHKPETFDTCALCAAEKAEAEVERLRAVTDAADAYVSMVRSDRTGSYEQWTDLRDALAALDAGESSKEPTDD